MSTLIRSVNVPPGRWESERGSASRRRGHLQLDGKPGALDADDQVVQVRERGPRRPQRHIPAVVTPQALQRGAQLAEGLGRGGRDLVERGDRAGWLFPAREVSGGGG